MMVGEKIRDNSRKPYYYDMDVMSKIDWTIRSKVLSIVMSPITDISGIRFSKSIIS